MFKFNRSMAILLIGVSALLGGSVAAAEMKIGVVNFQKLIEDSPQTKTTIQHLETEFEPRRREMLSLQTDLKARGDKFQREGSLMSETDRSKEEIALRDLQHDYQRKAQQFQDDATTRRNEELGKVQRYLVQEIATYANTQGFDLVVYGTFYAKPSIDITAQLTTFLATQPANIPATAAPQPAAPPASK
jgi:outer membrane protein